MKSFVAFFALVAFAAADISEVLKHEETAQTLREAVEVGAEGFNYVVETSNGISAQQSGVLKNAGREDAALEVTGSNSYTGPDGVQYKIVFISDENGYRPQGAHLPTPPTPLDIPEYILRSLEYIRTHPPKPERQQ